MLYSSDKRINHWLNQWKTHTMRPNAVFHPSVYTQAYRGMLAAQLRIIRKRHGITIARVFRDQISDISNLNTILAKA